MHYCKIGWTMHWMLKNNSFGFKTLFHHAQSSWTVPLPWASMGFIVISLPTCVPCPLFVSLYYYLSYPTLYTGPFLPFFVIHSPCPSTSMTTLGAAWTPLTPFMMLLPSTPYNIQNNIFLIFSRNGSNAPRFQVLVEQPHNHSITEHNVQWGVCTNVE